MAIVHRPSGSDTLNLNDQLAGDLQPDQVHHDWVRWCYASITKHFEERKSSYSLYLEGDERITQDLNQFAELRIDGPFIQILQKYSYWLNMEINVLCQTHVDPRRHYEPQVIVGVFTKAFENTINVYKLGDGPFDDGSLLGCFHLQRDPKEALDINYFGIIKEDVKLTHTTIEGHYLLELWTSKEN